MHLPIHLMLAQNKSPEIQQHIFHFHWKWAPAEDLMNVAQMYEPVVPLQLGLEMEESEV